MDDGFPVLDILAADRFFFGELNDSPWRQQWYLFKLKPDPPTYIPNTLSKFRLLQVQIDSLWPLNA